MTESEFGHAGVTSRDEVWRHLTVLGVAAAVVVAAGLGATWATRRVCAVALKSL